MYWVGSGHNKKYQLSRLTCLAFLYTAENILKSFLTLTHHQIRFNKSKQITPNTLLINFQAILNTIKKLLNLPYNAQLILKILMDLAIVEKWQTGPQVELFYDLHERKLVFKKYNFVYSKGVDDLKSNPYKDLQDFRY